MDASKEENIPNPFMKRDKIPSTPIQNVPSAIPKNTKKIHDVSSQHSEQMV